MLLVAPFTLIMLLVAPFTLIMLLVAPFTLIMLLVAPFSSSMLERCQIQSYRFKPFFNALKLLLFIFEIVALCNRLQCHG
jgi:phage-related holin